MLRRYIVAIDDIIVTRIIVLRAREHSRVAPYPAGRARNRVSDWRSGRPRTALLRVLFDEITKYIQITYNKITPIRGQTSKSWPSKRRRQLRGRTRSLNNVNIRCGFTSSRRNVIFHIDG